MIIERSDNNGHVLIALTGRLDTTTSPKLEEELKSVFDDAVELILDFSALEYLSSAGLRVILSSHKRATAVKRAMRIRNANESVMEVFEMTGFSDFLILE